MIGPPNYIPHQDGIPQSTTLTNSDRANLPGLFQYHPVYVQCAQMSPYLTAEPFQLLDNPWKVKNQLDRNHPDL